MEVIYYSLAQGYPTSKCPVAESPEAHISRVPARHAKVTHGPSGCRQLGANSILAAPCDHTPPPHVCCPLHRAPMQPSGSSSVPPAILPCSAHSLGLGAGSEYWRAAEWGQGVGGEEQQLNQWENTRWTRARS